MYEILFFMGGTYRVLMDCHRVCLWDVEVVVLTVNTLRLIS